MATAVLGSLLKKIAYLEQGYTLGQLNTLQAGGTADYFTVARNTVELVEAVQAAIESAVPYLIIGKADKVLFADSGFAGLVIQNYSDSYSFSADKSQLTADSGLPLDACITLAASRGFGGLTDWYGEGGSLGGAIYNNYPSMAKAGPGRGINSCLRSLIILQPRSHHSGQPVVTRNQPGWLLSSTDGTTKLKLARQIGGGLEPRPVIISAVWQLTRLRGDELRRRLTDKAASQDGLGDGLAFGPLFRPPLGSQLAVTPLLRQAGAATLTLGNIYPDRYNPNYLRSRGSAPASQVRQLIESLHELVKDRYGLDMERRYEYLGGW